MFSISPSEFIVIALVALVVVGPAKLLELSRKAGELAGKVKAAADDLRSGIESELGDVATPFREASSDLKAAGKELRETTEGELRWVDTPSTGEAPEEAQESDDAKPAAEADDAPEEAQESDDAKPAAEADHAPEEAREPDEATPAAEADNDSQAAGEDPTA